MTDTVAIELLLTGDVMLTSLMEFPAGEGDGDGEGDDGADGEGEGVGEDGVVNLTMLFAASQSTLNPRAGAIPRTGRYVVPSIMNGSTALPLASLGIIVFPSSVILISR